MSLVAIGNVGLSFGPYDVFSGISASLPHGARVGLVGPNGVGKTSLLGLLAGISPPTRGSVHRAQGVRLGYLRQEAVEALTGHQHSVYAEMRTVFAHVEEQAAQLREMEARMAAGEAGEALLAAYGAAQEAFERAGGYDYELRIQQVLDGLGFGREQWATPVGHLSGGQKTRALLARLLLERPTLLILDEPTNHLDVGAIEWLEGTLRTWDGALLVVSHDRYFLDRVVDYVWEMSTTAIEAYRGNYSAYVQQRQERWARNQYLYETELERLRKEMDLIRRYIAWRKFEEAKGKLKRLSRQLVAIKELGILGVQGKSWSETGVGSVHPMSVEEAHQCIKAIKPPSRPPVLHLRLPPAPRGGTLVLRTRALQVGYDGVPLFAADDIDLQRLQRAALIGPNGAGKTTFLRTVLGQLPPVAGEARLGGGLKIGYFAQAHADLDPRRTVLDELLAHRQMPQGEARDYLARYLFSGDDVWKPVGALSGGERSRLALAILTLDGVNVLLLDEPTNHLDIPTQEVLQEQLEAFQGTLLMVTHDRYLVDRLATQVWELRDRRLHVFAGTYQEFLSAREGAVPRPPAAAVPRDPPPPARPPEESARAAHRRAQALAALEERIAQAEAALAACGRQLQDGGERGHYQEVSRLSETYASTQTQLDDLLEQWTGLAAEQA